MLHPKHKLSLLDEFFDRALGVIYILAVSEQASNMVELRLAL